MSEAVASTGDPIADRLARDEAAMVARAEESCLDAHLDEVVACVLRSPCAPQ